MLETNKDYLNVNKVCITVCVCVSCVKCVFSLKDVRIIITIVNIYLRLS